MSDRFPKARRRQFLATLVGGAAMAQGAEPPIKAATAAAPKNISDFLEPIRANGKVPGLAAAVVMDGKFVGVGAVGIRKGGSPIPVKGTDLWHIGSCAKPMTATLIAIFVERRKLQWDMTITDALPELREGMNPAYRDVTLEQLLTHRSGIPEQADSKLWEDTWALRGTPAEQRYEFTKGALKKESESAPGTKYIYSNQNYSTAAAMLEKITGQSWETLMRENLLGPLKMSFTGFGVPGTIGQVDQPWGHKWKGGKLEPQQSDNPPAVYPAGGVHCSIYDFNRFAMFHLNGHNGEAGLLKPETFRKLHTPPGDQEYALGWVRVERDWADGWAYNHSGSNTLNFASVWFAPKVKFAAVVASNIGGESGEKACDEVVQALIKRYVLKT